MDAAHIDIIKNRLKPIADELLDGYIVMGYITGEDGRRTRLVLINNTTNADGLTKDCAVADGLAMPLSIARNWQAQGS